MFKATLAILQLSALGRAEQNNSAFSEFIENINQSQGSMKIQKNGMNLGAYASCDMILCNPQFKATLAILLLSALGRAEQNNSAFSEFIENINQSQGSMKIQKNGMNLGAYASCDMILCNPQ